MRRIRRAILAVLAGALLLWIVLTGWPLARAEYRSQALWEEVKRGPGADIDFAGLGPTGWDRVYFFHPYYPREAIQADLGFRWPAVNETSIEMNDGVNLVVFVRGGEVAGWFEHPLNRGDLRELANGVGYPREMARFKVRLDREGRAVLEAQ
jgi:hypothetical protein